MKTFQIHRVLVALAVCAGPGVAGQEQPAGPAEVDPDIAQLVEAHNRERAEHDLAPLAIAPKLMEAARTHARDMAEHQSLSHEGSDGTTPSERVERQGYHYSRTGENVAEGQKTVEDVMASWLNSPPHRANILGDFREIGAARAEDEDGRPYWSVSFGTPIPQLDPAEAADGLIKSINASRSDAGQQALEPDEALMKAARNIALELAGNHDGGVEGESNVLEQVKAAGYSYGKIAQSTATGQPTPEEVAKALMESDQQKESLLGEFEEIGVGYAAAADGTPFWCILLAVPRH